MEQKKKDTNDQELMRSMKVSKAVAAMAIPSVISSLVTVVYNMADTFFVGQTGDALQVAAVSLTNPIFILLMAFANMFGMGGSAVASMAMGEGKPEKAKNTTAFITYASLAIGVITAVLLFTCMAPILLYFWRKYRNLRICQRLCSVYCLGSAFLSSGLRQPVFVVRFRRRQQRSHDRKYSGNHLQTLCWIRCSLTGLHMGAAGAAIATTIGNILASLYFVWYFLKKSRQLSILPKDFTLREQISGRVCAIGLPTAIFSALMSVSTIVINQILVKYGNAPVAAIGIVFKANMFITFLQMGLANGVQPLLGYSYGAGNISRFREVERFTKICCLVTGIVATVLYFIGREPIIRMFISDDEVVYYGVKMLVAYMISGPVIGMLFVNMNCMQSVNHSLPATILSVMRQGVLLIPLLYVLQFFWGMEGVIYGQSITDYIAVFLSAVLWRNIRKKL